MEDDTLCSVLQVDTIFTLPKYTNSFHPLFNIFIFNLTTAVIFIDTRQSYLLEARVRAQFISKRVTLEGERVTQSQLEMKVIKKQILD